jgi:hypothetical protein
MTKIPAMLDAKLGALDEDGALRATTIEVGKNWSKKFCKALLSKPETTNLAKAQHRSEKAKAFDLLDAVSLSRASTDCLTCAAHSLWLP